MHYHAYQWVGPVVDLEWADEARRPSSSGHAAEFERSALPPFRLSDWLLRPARRIEQTFAEPEDAVRWLAAAYERTRPALHLPEQEARIGARARLDGADGALRAGVDVCWGFYLRDERFAHTAVVCCPNRQSPAYRCPLDRY